MTKKNPMKVISLISASAIALLLGGCFDDDCEECVQKDITYAWDIPQSQDDCAEGTIYTDDSGGEGGDADGTGIVDRDGTGIVDRDGDSVLQYCLHPCAGNEVPDPSGDIFIKWDNDNDFVEAHPGCFEPS